MRLSAYDTYTLFMAIRSHFTTKSYDYFKYHGKIKVTPDSFSTNKNRFQFQKLARQCDDKEMKSFLISNFIKDKKWVGEFLDDDAKQNHVNYIKYNQSVSYQFKNELDLALRDTENPSDLFVVKNGEYPKIIQLYMEGTISAQTFTILNSYIGFFSKFDKQIGESDIIWSKIRLKTSKLHPFLEYDKDRIKSILKQTLL